MILVLGAGVALLPLAAIIRALVTVLGEAGTRSATETIGLALSFSALAFGALFFAYSVRYYLASIVVLLGTYLRPGRHAGGTLSAAALVRGAHPAALRRISSRKGTGSGPAAANSNGAFHLPEWPFVSVQIASYNEKRVIGRVLEACARLDYPNYEVILCDDSTDESQAMVAEWRDHPGFRILHRDTRAGFKGGALTQALAVMDPRTEYVMVLDADAVPFSDAIQSFLPHFYYPNGHHPDGPQRREKVAAVQSYQWHVLNKREGWLTEAVRTEYAGSYMVERTLQEIVGAMKMIAGTAYMIRADLLREVGWGKSLTEDWELTLRLYQRGYKVAYTPYAEVPAECVGTFARLTRQRMRWAEGHSFNVRRFFWPILRSRSLTFWEKGEFLYFSLYYLQAIFLVAGTACWLVAELVLHVHIPTWTALLGWSLLFTNLLALPLLNLTGLFLEGAPAEDLAGILGAGALSMLLVPFQGWAAVKGLVEHDEGPWHRTPKTGSMTGTVGRIRRGRGLGRRLENLRRRGRPAIYASVSAHSGLRRRARATWIVIAATGLVVAGLGVAALGTPAGAAGGSIFYMHELAAGSNGEPLLDQLSPRGPATDLLMLNGSSVTWTTAAAYRNGSIPPGNWTFTYWWNSATCGAGANSCKVSVSVGALSNCLGLRCGGGSELFAFPTGQVSGQAAGSQTMDFNPGNLDLEGCPCALYVTISVVSTHGKTFDILFDARATPTNINAPSMPVPEHGLSAAMAALLLPPLALQAVRRRRRARV